MPTVPNAAFNGTRNAGKRAAPSDSRRQQILDTAVQLFGEKGYHATSLREVAAAAGLSQTDLLHHFPVKSSLLRGVLDRMDFEVIGRLHLNIAAPDGEEWMRSLIVSARHNASQPQLVRLFTTLASEATSPDHPAHHYFQRRYRLVRRTLTAALKDLNSKGLLKQTGLSPEETAELIAAGSDGLQVQWLLEPESMDLVAAIRNNLKLHVDLDL